MTDGLKRREFVKQLAAATGGVIVLPSVFSCGGSPTAVQVSQTGPVDEPIAEPVVEVADDSQLPTTRPESWDPLGFNRERGNLGAIPLDYREAINGPDGDAKHLGKHLPYIPKVDGKLVPPGYLPVMWGDPSLGYAQHPNAAKDSETYPLGHFYTWVKIRKATDQPADELESRFGDWPESAEGDSGRYAPLGPGNIEDNSGKGTIYLVKLPEDVAPGDSVRVWGNCQYHGEYLDFAEVPQL